MTYLIKTTINLFFILVFSNILFAQVSEKKFNYKAKEIVDIDSVPADFPVSFSFISDGDWQIVAYYNKDRSLTVATRKLSEDKWKRKSLPTKVGWDSHNRIVMALDRDNCIHVAANMHNDSMTYFITKKPYDISSFAKIFPLVSVSDELKSTYPTFIKTAENQLVFTYRKGGSGNGITITNIYQESTKSFKRLTNNPLFDGLNQMSAYASGPRLDPDGNFHVAWLWRNTPHCETNHHLSYARSKDLINWETVAGETFELPITPNSKQFTVDPAPPGGGLINGAYRLFFDKNGNPLIVYMKYDEEGNNQLFIAKTENGKWITKQITHWDYRWAFSGPGSITFEIRLKKAEIDHNNRIKVEYWHINRGNGEILVNQDPFNVVEDKKVNEVQKAEYPEELLMPQRSEPGMTVHWLKPSLKDKNDDLFYVLRWETEGKKRFYKQPETVVPPSVLRLYTFSREK
ncbi:BNR repeat-containing protein [Flexithrix dorotheae]|uniref:BNR repeat-containing protein n=1 Tax=Flexithrix dorotheae TaxID=70993 RepID=UPI000360DECC|nr:BNR repeat-containing protein [Flexithrix dorotheae]